MLAALHYFAGVAMLASAAAPAHVPIASERSLGDTIAGLVDQNGRPFAARSIQGKVVLVNFIFTGCGATCPTQTAQLAQFERSLPRPVRDRIRIVSISVDPRNDTPQVLRRYARTFGVDGARWQFLTGPLPEIMKITRSFSALRPDQASDASFHTSELRVFDTQSRMVQRYSGAPLAERQLRADLMTLTGTRG